MPLGALGGALLGWSNDAPTDAARLEQTILMALVIGFVVTPAVAAAFASARYQRPLGTGLEVLLRSVAIPAIGGLAWGLLGAALALLVAPLAGLSFSLWNFPLIASVIGLSLGAVVGLLTLLVRTIGGGARTPSR